MSKSLNIPYTPNIVPNDPADLPRWLDIEMNKIANAFIAQPVALSVEEVDSFTVTTVVTWVQVFLGEVPEWDVPGGNFDQVTGVWTCPQTGLYSVDVQLEVSPFGAGNKTYYAGVRITVDSGGVITAKESTDGGDDSIPLGVSLSGLLRLQQGDKLAVEMTIVHDQFVGVADYEIGWQILAVSG